jgi:Aminoglycoside-2''-adenylyltransferase
MKEGRGMAAPESFDADPDAWAAWRPEEVARLLANVQTPWYVAGGWAIDLFLGGQRREHEDLDLAVPYDRFHELAPVLAGYDLFLIGGQPRRAWPLEHAGDASEPEHQVRAREPASGLWRFGIFRERYDGNTWICRRDARIRLPYDRVVASTSDGLPYARPEIALLFKGKAPRPKDDDDFAAALPHLTPAARRWLATALALVYPDHRWLADLG